MNTGKTSRRDFLKMEAAAMAAAAGGMAAPARAAAARSSPSGATHGADAQHGGQGGPQLF
jgi:anaerobic selenocysteine-containing dehydrogenase